MKELKITVEFITPCLVLSPFNKETNSEYFDRDSQGNIIWNQAWWYSAITKAAEMCEGTALKPQSFHWSLTLDAKTDFIKVVYKKGVHRNHECLPVKNPVTFEAAVSSDTTEESVRALFTKLGKYVGMSPYGYNLGFGKFNVISITIT